MSGVGLNLRALLEDTGFGELSGVVKEAMQAHQAKAKARLGELLLGTLGQADQVLRNHVAQLKRLRQQEKIASQNLKKLGRTVDVLHKTGNPLPFFKEAGLPYLANDFCAQLGVPVPEGTDPIWNG